MDATTVTLLAAHKEIRLRRQASTVSEVDLNEMEMEAKESGVSFRSIAGTIFSVRNEGSFLFPFYSYETGKHCGKLLLKEFRSQLRESNFQELKTNPAR